MAKRKSTKSKSPRKSKGKTPSAAISKQDGKSRFDLRSEVTNKVIAALESGNIPFIRPWSDAKAAKFGGGNFGIVPVNAASGRRYSGINIVLLWMAKDASGYTDNRWATFKQALAAGGCVRKGEKGTLVVFNKPFARTVTDANGDETEKRGWIAVAHWVFNVAQIDGADWSNSQDDTGEDLTPQGLTDESVTAWLRELRADVRHGGPRAFYSPARDYVQMPDARAFTSDAAYRATLCHELVHWTGHESRLARDFSGRFGNEAYAFEELVAEMGAAFACAELGVDYPVLQHASYVQSWIKVLKDDKTALFRACSLASKAADLLTEAHAKSATRKTTGTALVLYKPAPLPAIVYPVAA